MQLLMFQIAGDQFAIDAACVIEVVPRIPWRAIHHAPAHLVGTFSYRGRVVPVIDLGLLVGSAACEARLGTRIILVDFPSVEGDNGVLGLVAERVSDVRTVPRDRVPSVNLMSEQAPYLGPILQLDDGLVQLIDVERIVPQPLRGALSAGRGEDPE